MSTNQHHYEQEWRRQRAILLFPLGVISGVLVGVICTVWVYLRFLALLFMMWRHSSPK